jgi:cellulose synthase/poly-beta-1,6-N-acetylglucosamine synthase-like glycosyltransferase
MIEWFIRITSFFALFIGVFWLQVIFLKSEKKEIKLSFFPKVSIIVPARNEEKAIWKTVSSIVKLNYPKEKIEVIIVDHSSTDNTAKIAKDLIKTYTNHNIRIVTKEHRSDHIKAHAFNEGLKHVTGEFVACVDADTIVLENSLREMIKEFQEENVGAVISTIKVYRPKKIIEKIQHLEYIFATFARSLMSKIDTLHVTPGALSVYKKEMFDKYGPMDEKTETEDLEMAMRIRFHGYRVKIALKSITYTKVPNTFKTHWNQRIRWFRGFIQNNLKYREMMFNKKHGMMGSFQYPLNIATFGTIILMFGVLLIEFIRRSIIWFSKFRALGLEVFAFELPNIKEIVLNLNITFIFPILTAFIVGLLIYHMAHKTLKEKWQFPLALGTYLTVYPFLRTIHWVTATYKETFRAKKKW